MLAFDIFEPQIELTLFLNKVLLVSGYPGVTLDGVWIDQDGTELRNIVYVF